MLTYWVLRPPGSVSMRLEDMIEYWMADGLEIEELDVFWCEVARGGLCGGAIDVELRRCGMWKLLRGTAYDVDAKPHLNSSASYIPHRGIIGACISPRQHGNF